MAERVVKTWEQELLARGEARGVRLGEVRGEARAYRENLTSLLERRFSAVPEVVQRRIEAINDVALLRTLVSQAWDAPTLEALEL